MRQRWSSSVLPMVVAAGLGFAGAYFVLAPDKGTSAVQMALGSFGGGCKIKGNVSIASGERIYHLPGQRYYGETEIRHDYGERYFCSEAEARAAGWRRSRV